MDDHSYGYERHQRGRRSVPAWRSQSGLLAPFATGLWSIGLVLYLLLVSLILLRWLTVAMTPQTLGLAFMKPISRLMLWVAIAAWVLVAAALLARLARRLAQRS